MNVIDYFRGLAERHIDVRHGVHGEVHFISSQDEVHTSLDSMLCYPAIIVDRGAGFAYDGAPGAYIKHREYVVMVVDHVTDTSDNALIEATLDKCERIFDNCINQLMQDKKQRKVKWSFDLEDTAADYIRNTDNQLYGVAATLVIGEPYKAANCEKAFLLDRAFDETFDKSFN